MAPSAQRRSNKNMEDGDNGKSHEANGNGSENKASLTANEQAWGYGNTRIVRYLACYRFVLFSILVYDYATYLPQAPWMDEGIDRWFTYDQFGFFYDWAPKHGDPVWGAEATVMLYNLGLAAGITAALGGIPGVAFSYELAGIVMVFLYAFRFLTFVQFFTNHNYLFLLLGILVVVSGGGSYQPFVGSEEKLQRLIQKSEWGAVMIRIQYAIIYLYASVWKITPDWLDGSICKAIFLTFQEQGVNRGVPWDVLYGEFGPPLFKLVALGGVGLDSAMFVALTFRRPNIKTTKLFTTLSIMFHGFVCFTMSQRIGYTFPACCLSGSLIFQPIGSDPEEEDYHEDEYSKSKKDDDYANDHTNGSSNHDNRNGGVVVVHAKIVSVSVQNDEGNLLEWVQRYVKGTKAARASKWQRLFALAWTFWQLGMPARMPIISKGTFHFTARCYRFSWTMMLHSRGSFVLHKGNLTNPDGTLSDQEFGIAFDMIQLYPECADIVPIQRHAYQASSIFRHSDPRTLPLINEMSGLVGMRQRALIDQFPRHVARVGGGWSDDFYQKVPGGCKNQQTGENRQLSVYGVVYSKLNNKGAFCRIYDPTINLAKAEKARKERNLWQTIQGVVLDRAPPGHEYLLLEGVGSFNSKAEEHKKQLAKYYPEAKKIELISDRGACLASRPLALWPAGFPLAVVPLELPYNVELTLSRRSLPENTPPDKQWDALSEPTQTTLSLRKMEKTGVASMIEFSAKAGESLDLGKCGDTTEEDVLFALLFLQ